MGTTSVLTDLKDLSKDDNNQEVVLIYAQACLLLGLFNDKLTKSKEAKIYYKKSLEISCNIKSKDFQYANIYYQFMPINEKTLKSLLLKKFLLLTQRILMTHMIALF